jgi:hypothetical protein
MSKKENRRNSDTKHAMIAKKGSHQKKDKNNNPNIKGQGRCLADGKYVGQPYFKYVISRLSADFTL